MFAQGFLTPAHLHFVRNHGAVPKLPPPSALLPSAQSKPELVGLTDAAKVSLDSVAADTTYDPYANWSIRIHGLVAHEKTMNIRDLAETFKVVTLPVTLVCAGNRRKEQNVVRKSLGFDWGAAGGRCSYHALKRYSYSSSNGAQYIGNHKPHSARYLVRSMERSTQSRAGTPCPR